jgi:hypothetical protein
MIVERPMLERRILGAIHAGRIPVVLGGCGTGRTSVLLRLERLLGTDRAQYLDLAAAATTPERCFSAVRAVSRLQPGVAAPLPTGARAAFDGLLTLFDEARAADGTPGTFLLDEVLDVRTFESFPGLRHVQRELVSRLAASPSGFVLASRFTARGHRLLRDAPARFEVVHAPPLEAQDVVGLALLFDGGRREWATQIAPILTALTAGRAAYVHLLLEALAAMGAASDPVAALAALLAPDGRLTARCRESYEFRLHRARGYGALKAILSVLAETEPLTLTEISQQLHRTPGSTKDYLSWLEDVDLIASHGKRYTFEDPILRLFVRLYGRPVPPTDDDVVREVQAFAQSRLPALTERRAQPVYAAAERQTSDSSGIIEID